LNKPKKLSRTVQCAKCPWKVSTDPYDIPNGYCEIKHQNLKNTIVVPGEIKDGPLRIMACHHSTEDNMQHCIGWLKNQLGEGNNIPLRLQMLQYANAGEIKTKGKQHRKFEDTLPK
jgi:hypothetical protein